MEKRRIEKFPGLFDSILSVFAFLSGLLLIFTTLSVCVEVVMRYFLNQPLTWVDEITEYILLYITFLGAAWVLKNDGHVIIDLVLMKLRVKGRMILGLISSTVCILSCSALVWYGAQVAWDHYQRGVYNPTLLEFPKGPVIAIIPVGSFFLLIQFLRRFYGYLKTRGTVQKERV